MRYPQTFLDDLKRQADIVRVVQDYVQLKKKGANWMACCPFHKEKTPSFSVSPAKEIFYCFGCHKGGSVFNFVMEMERVSFPEAIKLVAEKSGVPLPKLVDDSRFEARRNEAESVISNSTSGRWSGGNNNSSRAGKRVSLATTWNVAKSQTRLAKHFGSATRPIVGMRFRFISDKRAPHRIRSNAAGWLLRRKRAVPMIASEAGLSFR